MIERYCRKCRCRKPLEAFPVKATPGPARVCNLCLGRAPAPVQTRELIRRQVSRARNTKAGRAIAASFEVNRLARIQRRAGRMARARAKGVH